MNTHPQLYTILFDHVQKVWADLNIVFGESKMVLLLPFISGKQTVFKVTAKHLKGTIKKKRSQ